MPAVTWRRPLVALLSLVLLAGSGVAPAAAQDAQPTPIPPVSFEAAVASLLTAGLAGEVHQATTSTLPKCRVQDKQTRFAKVKHWKKTLLDTRYKLPASYKPWDLVSVSRADIAGSGKVRKIMIEDLKALAKAARVAGKPLAVRYAYRSFDYQKSLFRSYVNRYGRSQALMLSARAGHSEHQMGTTVDFKVGPGVPLSTSFGDSPSGKWLAKNGWKYGFIMSYPKGKKGATCYGYEPWHWRYFGRDRARAIHQSGQVPRRYLYESFHTDLMR